MRSLGLDTSPIKGGSAALLTAGVASSSPPSVRAEGSPSRSAAVNRVRMDELPDDEEEDKGFDLTRFVWIFFHIYLTWLTMSIGASRISVLIMLLELMVELFLPLAGIDHDARIHLRWDFYIVNRYIEHLQARFR